MLNVLAFDPGTNNHAWAALEVESRPVRYRVLAHGMLESPFKEMSGMDVGVRIQKFAKEVRALKREFDSEFAVAERYMTRGHGGTTIEAVSVMLGVIAQLFGKNVTFLAAATWKNAINKKFSLDSVYTELSPLGIVPHRIDAVGIGVYGASMVLGKPCQQVVKSKQQFKKQILDAR